MLRSRLASLDPRPLLAAGLLAFGLAAPAAAHDFTWSEDTHFLDKLIEMDADDIEEIRADLVEAQADLAEEARNIKREKARMRDEPAFVRAISGSAFAAASEGMEDGAKGLEKAFKGLDRAEKRLGERRAEIGEAEYKETMAAIKMLRTELAGLQDGLETLALAMKE